MKLLFVAALLANWSYDGFVADPAKPQPSAPPQGAAAPAATAPKPKPEPAATTVKPPELPPRPPSAKAKPAKKAKVRAAVAAPVRWRLADSTGQVWEDTDPDWLSRWVAERNAQVAYAAAYYTNAPAAPGHSWTCTPNGCYRTSP